MTVLSSAKQNEWAAVRSRIDARLAELVPEGSADDRLNRSMRHSLLTPGKRLRPMMTVLTAVDLGATIDMALDPACAIEMVHTASLIVDDLPFMDDATLRRGRRTAHGRFGVEIAVLAGVSLLNRAPAVIASCAVLDASLRLGLIQALSIATGEVRGLAAGQMEDLMAQRKTTDLEDLERIVRHKTGALFVCAAETGARIAGADDEMVCTIHRFATHFGLAFQALDDLADLDGSAGEPDQDAGQDVRKATYATLLEPQEARAFALGHANEAQAELATIGLADSGLAKLAELALATLAG